MGLKVFLNVALQILGRKFYKITKKSSFPYLKYPHLIWGTPNYKCGTPHEHTEYMRILCGTLNCNTELCKGFRTCGISSTSTIGKVSVSMWKICGEFRLSFFTMRKNAEIINLNKFCSGKYLRKISSAEILDLHNFTSEKYLRKLISLPYAGLDHFCGVVIFRSVLLRSTYLC